MIESAQRENDLYKRCARARHINQPLPQQPTTLNARSKKGTITVMLERLAYKLGFLPYKLFMRLRASDAAFLWLNRRARALFCTHHLSLSETSHRFLGGMYCRSWCDTLKRLNRAHLSIAKRVFL